MTVWAGSWLIWSVCIDRMMQISSAIAAMSGRQSEISWPDSPCLRKRELRPEALQLLPLELRDRLALR